MTSRVPAALGLALCVSCAIPAKAPLPSPPVEPDDYRVWAGVSSVDITPPPGLALFGHGPEARVASGMRARIRCQSFVLAAGSDLVAIVPCDLAAPSIELQRAVANLLLQRRVPIGADRLFMTATHTHAGPAHYFGARRFSGSFSSYQPGFDQKVLDFLAERIAAGVAEAYAKRAPACVAWGYDFVYGLTHNRSYLAYAENKSTALGLDLAQKNVDEQNAYLKPVASPQKPEGNESRPNVSLWFDNGAARSLPAAFGDDAPRTYVQAAVDPTISVLRIDAARSDMLPAQACSAPTKPLGLLAFFGMHPTGIPATNDLYHGDIFGFATRALEACVPLTEKGRERCEDAPPAKDAPAPFVAGIANGIEGDVSPSVDFQSAREANRVGRALALQIRKVYDRIGADQTLTGQAVVRHAYRELRLPNALVAPGSSERLCPGPEIGASAAGGAEDGPTRFRIIPEFNEGRHLEGPFVQALCHRQKLALVAPEGHATADGLQYPAIAPIGLVQIGAGYVAMLPAEPTTVTGLRIRFAASEQLRGARVAVAGLVNSYLDYVATEDEYPLQHYEGASTLYGPNSSRFFVSQFSCLATWLTTNQDAACRLGQEFDVNTLHAIESDPKPIVNRMPADDAEQESVQLLDVEAKSTLVDGLPGETIHFSGPAASALAHRSQLSIQVVSSDGSVVDDDRGSNMEVRYGDDWTARWLPYLQAGDPRCSGREPRYHFEVRGRVSLRSQAFGLDCSNLRSR